MLVTVTLVRASFSRFSVSGPEIEEFVDKGQLRIDLKAASINVACIPQVTCPVDERDPDEFDFDLLEPCLEPYRLIVHLTRNTTRVRNNQPFYCSRRRLKTTTIVKIAFSQGHQHMFLHWRRACIRFLRFLCASSNEKVCLHVKAKFNSRSSPFIRSALGKR